MNRLVDTGSCNTMSNSNIAHVNYVLQHIVDLLGDPKFASGTILIVVFYEAQRNLYSSELGKRANLELNSEGKYVEFDKSRIDVRTHHGAQGHDATMVIVDMVRSNKVGFTGEAEMIVVASSRFQMWSIGLDEQEAHHPLHRALQDKGSPPNQTPGGVDARLRLRWYGYKIAQCPLVMSGKKLVCPKLGCGGNHHLCDCWRERGDKRPAKAIEEAKKPETKQSETNPELAETPPPVQPATTVTEGSKREKEFGQKSRNLLREMEAEYMGEDGEDEAAPGTSGWSDEAAGGEASAWGAPPAADWSASSGAGGDSKSGGW